MIRLDANLSAFPSYFTFPYLVTPIKNSTEVVKSVPSLETVVIDNTFDFNDELLIETKQIKMPTLAFFDDGEEFVKTNKSVIESVNVTIETEETISEIFSVQQILTPMSTETLNLMSDEDIENLFNDNIDSFSNNEIKKEEEVDIDVDTGGDTDMVGTTTTGELGVPSLIYVPKKRPQILEENNENNWGQNLGTQKDKSIQNNELNGGFLDFVPTLPLPSKKVIGDSTVKWIKRIAADEFEYKQLPKLWYECLVKNKLTYDWCFSVSSFIWNLTKNGECTISSIALDSIDCRYKKVVECLVRDVDLVKKGQSLHIFRSWSTGTETNEPYCQKYSTKHTSEVQLVAVSIKGKGVRNQRNIDDSDFSQWQYGSLKNLSIDFKAAIEYMMPNTKDINHQQLIIQLIDIYRGNHYLITGKTGRIFHLVSNLKKDYRQFLRLNGNPCKNIDLRASQVAIMGKMFIEKSAPQANEFKSILLKERVYDYFYNKYSPKCTLDDYKKKFLQCFYDAPGKDYQIGKHFKSELPQLWEWIEEYKKPNFKDFSRSMQKIECDWVFNTAKLLPCNCITIHDSFLVEDDNVDVCYEIIKYEIEKYNIPTIAKIE